MQNRTAGAPERETLTIEGYRIAIQKSGKNRPIFYLHDEGGAQWHPFLSKLAERYQVIVPEHPGFGTSEIPGWLDNIHDVAFFYRQLLRELDLGEVHLVGGSLGGWIAMEIAVKDTRNVASLSLAAPAGIYAKGVKRPDTFLWSPEELTRHLYHDKSIAERLVAEPPTPEQVDAGFKNRFMIARLAWQPRYFDPHLAKWLHQIDRPMQFIWGANDEIFPVEYVEAYRSLLPKADYVVIEKCGHVPHLENPDAFVRNVDNFVAGARK